MISNLRFFFLIFGAFFAKETKAWVSSTTFRTDPNSMSQKLMANEIQDGQRHRERSILFSANDASNTLNDVEPKSRNIFKAITHFISFTVRRLLWPGLSKGFDPNIKAPLPDTASLGCPFFGRNILAGSRKKGPEFFYSETSAKLGHPRIWRFYFAGMPVISVSGAENVNAVLKDKKFNIASLESFESSSPDAEKVKEKKKRPSLFTNDSVMFETNSDRHKFLRRLIGSAFTKQAIKDGMPNIVQSADEQIKRILPMQSTKMEDICDRFTLDIAWRQIIGLDLKDEDDIKKFQKAVRTYVSSMFSIIAYVNVPGKTLTAPYRARKYLVSKIKERIAQLEANGPDGTTLSAMLYSRDEDSKKKLNHDEIVENALILLVAGTETSSSTLASAVFFLGLYPQVYEKLAQEQQQLISNHGAKITSKSLEECTYLDAVIKETMRLVPVSGTNLRKNTGEGFILDGKQVPKGATVFCNVRLTHELDPKAPFSMDPRNHFEPERWLDAEAKPGDDYLPFGAGSRICLGKSLAMAEMRVFLSVLVRTVERFELVGVGGSTQPSIRWNPQSIIPKPADGVPIRATLTR